MTYNDIATRVNSGETFAYGSPEDRFYYGQLTEAEFNAEIAA